MKKTAIALLPFALFIAACDSTGAAVDVPNPERVERKEWSQMTKEEKIEFIKRTPMPEEAKQKQIEAIQAGQG